MRRHTRQIRLGAVAIGGGVPISIQTMAKADPADVEAIVAQLCEAKAAGCDIGRIAVPDLAAAGPIQELKERTGLPIVADVHFDYRLAVEAAKRGADGLRVNPGNLGGPQPLRAVVEAAGKAGIPIRVGVNGGSLPKKDGRPVKPSAGALAEAAQGMVAEITGLGFNDLKVSLKAFDVATTIEANRLFAGRSDLPLHLGLTEAGTSLAGAIRSTAALAPLILEGIGDTLRISLSAPPVQEVRAARILLRALACRGGPVVVACPTCGRTHADLAPVAARLEALLEDLGLDRVVAVMGCEVNGPGEAREADLGIAFGPSGEGLLFEAGEVVGRHPNAELEGALVARLRASGEGEEDEDGR
jgi:(E)-4-hydroxy-3-methylbut-2-enyl-diphosphate synthase